jgi:hypothetical protein
MLLRHISGKVQLHVPLSKKSDSPSQDHNYRLREDRLEVAFVVEAGKKVCSDFAKPDQR